MVNFCNAQDTGRSAYINVKLILMSMYLTFNTCISFTVKRKGTEVRHDEAGGEQGLQPKPKQAKQTQENHGTRQDEVLKNIREHIKQCEENDAIKEESLEKISGHVKQRDTPVEIVAMEGTLIRISETTKQKDVDGNDCYSRIDATVKQKQVSLLRKKIHQLESSAKVKESVHKVAQEIKHQELEHESQTPEAQTSSSPIKLDHSVQRIGHNVRAIQAMKKEQEKDAILSWQKEIEKKKSGSLEKKVRLLVTENKELHTQLNAALHSKNELEELPSCVKKIADLMDKNDCQAKILMDLVESITSKSGRHTWSQESKSLFAILLNVGGPAAHEVLRHNIGGPSLPTSYTVARPHQMGKVASVVSDIEFESARYEVYNKRG